MKKPFVLRYTTSPEWGEHAVSGTVEFIWLVSGTGVDPRTAVVALLTKKPRSNRDGSYTGFDVIAAADTVSENGAFKIERIRDGTYWPALSESNRRLNDGRV